MVNAELRYVGNIEGPEGPRGPEGDEGQVGPRGPQGLPGTNGVATDEAVAANISTEGTATRTALDQVTAGFGTTIIAPHGSDAFFPRPNGTVGNVLWVGAVQPRGFISGQDMWVKPKGAPEPDFVVDGIQPAALWLASDLPLGAGEVVGTWASTDGAESATGAGTVGVDRYGQKYVSFNGVDQRMTTTYKNAGPHFAAAVGRVVSRDPGVTTPIIGQPASGGASIGAYGDPGTFYANGGVLLDSGQTWDDEWHWFRLNWSDEGFGLFQIDRNDYWGATLNSASPSVAPDGYMFGGSQGAQANYSHVEIKAFAVWPAGGGLSTSQAFLDLREAAMSAYRIG